MLACMLALAAPRTFATQGTVPPPKGHASGDNARIGETAHAGDTAHVGEHNRQLFIGDALPPHTPHAHLVVGITDLPPWSIPPNVETPYWSGLASLVWKQVATTLKIDYEIRVLGYKELTDALADGSVDLGITGMPIVPESLARFSMTPPFDESGVSIATHARRNLPVVAVIRRILAPEVSVWLLMLLLLAFGFAAFFWFAERGRNPSIERSPIRGIAESTWWSLSTLSTVGYGDRVPVTRGGRVIGIAWMIFGFLLMTVSAGVITSVLTVDRLDPAVAGPSQLPKVRVGVVRDSSGERYVQRANIEARRFETVEDAYAALEEGELDAVVGATTSLDYLAEQTPRRAIAVLPQPLVRDFVGFGMRFGFDTALEKRVELEIVKAAQSGEYRAMRGAMLGKSESAATTGSRR